MTKIRDIGFADLLGASVQWRAYIRDTLGFDNQIRAEAGVSNDEAHVYLAGRDLFQEYTDYNRKIGQLHLMETANVDSDWDEFSVQIWERLQKAMKRDERELRHGLTVMGGVIEHSKTYTSAVGKMLADRILAARDEASAHLIEFRQAQPAE